MFNDRSSYWRISCNSQSIICDLNLRYCVKPINMESTINKKIGRTLRLIRESRNLKQSYVAERAGYAGKSTYARIEAGTLKQVGIEKIAEICNVLDCNVSYVMLLAVSQDFKYKLQTWGEFYDSIKGLTAEERVEKLKLVNALFNGNIPNDKPSL